MAPDQPVLAADPAQVAQRMNQRLVGRRFGLGGEFFQRFPAVYAVHQHVFVMRSIQLAFCQQALHKINRAHLGNQRRVECDLGHAVHDFVGLGRQRVAQDRVNLHQHDVAALAAVDQRVNSRVTGITPIPEMVAIDFHRLEHHGQAGRRHHRAGGQALARKDLRLAAGYAGCHHKHLGCAGVISCCQAGKVHLFFQKTLQRIDVKWIALVGRQRAGPVTRHRVGPETG